MINITFFGNTDDFLFDTFDDIDLVSATGSQIVVRDASSGFVTTINGRNFREDASAESGFRGTVTGFTTETATGARVATLTGLSVEVDAFDAAIDTGSSRQQLDFAALLNTDDVTFDGRPSNTSINLRDFFDGVTSRITLTGSGFEDRLQGAAGNDRITPGFAEFDDTGDFILGTSGNDTIDLSNVGAEQYIVLTYPDLNGPLTVNYNGATNTASVVKTGQGVDTIIDPNGAPWGLEFIGTAANDTFNVAAAADVFTTVTGDVGNDIFNITGTGTVRVNYRYGWQEDPSQGMIANLATGVISNDGYGGRDQLNFTPGAARLEIQATRLADNIVGSASAERFILNEGNDTLNAGEGIDLLRYDRSGVQSVDVDLAADRATAVWDSGTFTDVISGVEEVRGSRSGNDTMAGDDGYNRFEGRGGNDLLEGHGGDDWLLGGEGNDTILGGAGTDRLFGSSGSDYLNPGDNTDFDYVNPHTGNDTVDATDMLTGYLDVAHWDLAYSSAQIINIDGEANTGSVDKGLGNGITTFVNVANAMKADGFALSGSALDDIFNITVAEGGWTQLSGGRGNDRFNIGTSADSIVRLDYSDGVQNDMNQSSGLRANLETGIVSNDGFGGRDTINATDLQTIELRGTDLADVMVGSAGDDRFIGRGGNDTVDGGAGEDLMRYDRGGSSDGVAVNLGTGIARGAWEGVAFTDTLDNIENIRGSSFADSLAGDLGGNGLSAGGGNDFLYGDGIQADLTGEVSGQVYRMYQATLDRAPDARGYESWLTNLFEGNLSLQQMASGFVNSPEFSATYGDLANSGFVELLFQNVLGRASDTGGLQFWLSQLDVGATRADVVVGFAQSQEFQIDTASASAEFALSQSETHWTDEIYRVYRATLDRDPDLGGFTTWAARLGSGTAFDEMIDGFVNSTEFGNTYGSLDDAGFVELLYQNVLGRSADAGGLQTWLDVLGGGGARAEVVRGFSQSGEFRADTAADLKSWVQQQGTQDTLEGEGGNDLLMGGMLADRFIFDQADAGGNTIVDFEEWDILRLVGFEYDGFADLRAHMTQQGSDLVFIDQGVSVAFRDTDLAELTAAQVELF